MKDDEVCYSELKKEEPTENQKNWQPDLNKYLLENFWWVL